MVQWLGRAGAPGTTATCLGQRALTGRRVHDLKSMTVPDQDHCGWVLVGSVRKYGDLSLRWRGRSLLPADRGS